MAVQDPMRLRETVQDYDKFNDMIVERLTSSAAELEILSPGEGDIIRLPASGAHGVEVKLGYQDGRLAYDLKVPLRHDDAHAYAIGTDGDEKIGIGFETPEVDLLSIAHLRILFPYAQIRFKGPFQKSIIRAYAQPRCPNASASNGLGCDYSRKGIQRSKSALLTRSDYIESSSCLALVLMNA
jgi:hypothetical protein